MSMTTPQEVLQAIDRLRVFQRDDQRAVHKPLLLLLALARMTEQQPRLARYDDIEAPLKHLLAEFGPSSAVKTPHNPYWHLQSDGLWTVDGPPELKARKMGSTPTKGELRQPSVMAGFTPEVDSALRHDPALRSQMAHRLLDEFFPSTLHEDILAGAGLDLNTLASPLEAHEPVVDLVRRKRRDPGFRDRVLRAYEHRCCVCGFDLRIGHSTVGVEAAHIKWHNYQGPDIEPNGLALCSLHHKVFDMGGFTIEPAERRVVCSEQAIMGDQARHLLLGHHGQPIRKPVRAEYLPKAEFLGWHEKEVFKSPGRTL
jgi:putative restriction endonuclease